METNSLEGSICLQSLDPERGCSLKPRTRAVVSSLCFGPGATLQKSPWPGAPALLGVNPKKELAASDLLTVVRGCWGLWTLAPPSLTCPAGMRSLSNTGRSSCLLLRPRGQVVDPAWFSWEALQRLHTASSLSSLCSHCLEALTVFGCSGAPRFSCL